MDIVSAVHKAEVWMDEYEGVIGVSQGKKEGKPVIVVFISDAGIQAELPPDFEGYPVIAEITDEFTNY